VHLTAHVPIDLEALGADVFACSPYKFCGPHCGVLAANPQTLEALHPDKLVPSTDAVPERFELGTLPYELLAGTAAAVDFLADLVPGDGTRRDRIERSMRAVEVHEDALRRRIESALRELDGVTVHSRAERRTPTLLLTFADRSPQDAYRFLAELDVNAPAGTFYAYEPARRLGLPEGGLRIGLAPYNDDSDVDRLLDGLRKFLS
jgi:selenocysteine lyase/cysteine desulfurase